MAKWLEVDETVYVHRSRVEGAPEAPGAFFKTKVLEKDDRSVKVDLRNNGVSDWVSAKFAHRKVGLAIIQFGDFSNEATNLDPLSKGILQNARILYGDDDYIRYIKIRSKSELRHIFATSLFSFADKIALIGHGASDGTLTIGSKELSPSDFGEIIATAANPPDVGWQILCSVCNSGRAVFGRALSKYENVDCVVGPRDTVHSAEMAQFLQSFLNWNLLAGYTTTVAAKYAKHASTGTGTFTMWRAGRRQSLSYS